MPVPGARCVSVGIRKDRDFDCSVSGSGWEMRSVRIDCLENSCLEDHIEDEVLAHPPMPPATRWFVVTRPSPWRKGGR